MNKSQTELINYAVMPGYEMEIVSIVYDRSYHQEAQKLLLSNSGHNCIKTSDLVSRFELLQNLHPVSNISECNLKFFQRDLQLIINK